MIMQLIILNSSKVVKRKRNRNIISKADIIFNKNVLSESLYK